jgi:proline dehydrogenase
VLRDTLLSAARNRHVERAVTTFRLTQRLVERYVPGPGVDDAVRATKDLAADGLRTTIDYLGEDVESVGQATEIVQTYVTLLESLGAAGLAQHAEVSVKLSAIGQAVPDDGTRIAYHNAREICSAAKQVGTTVTIDMEDHTTTDSTLRVVAELRQHFPDTGCVVQAYLHRTEADCRALATPGSRVRLCKGAYHEPPSVAYQSKRDVDLSYVRCLKVLLAGPGHPMIATHDPRLIEIAGALAVRHERKPDSYEYQMLYGIRPNEQRRLAGQGATMRVYLPFGNEWYGYLMRRLAERPANIGFLARSLVSKS